MSITARNSHSLLWRHSKSTLLYVLSVGICAISDASINTCTAQTPAKQNRSWTAELTADPPTTSSLALKIPSGARAKGRTQRAEPLLIRRSPSKRMAASSRSAIRVRPVGSTQTNETESTEEPAIPAPKAASTENSAPAARPNVTNQLNRMQQERDARYRRLMKQLQKVKDLNRLRALQKQMQQQTPPVQEPDPEVLDAEASKPPEETPPTVPEQPGTAAAERSNDETKTNNDTTTAEPQPSLNEEVPETESTDAASAPTTNDTETAEAPSNGTDPSEAEQSVFEEGLGAKKIVAGTVNRVGMADSLYRLEELELALDTYNKIDRMELPMSERYWVVYQIACCHRRLGQTDEAQSLYRRLASERTKSGWLGEMSRWWLDQIDSRQELVTELEAQKDIIKQIQEIISPAEDETDAEALPGI